jgi:glycosyltransferase involved in cell wall biosynthesis
MTRIQVQTPRAASGDGPLEYAARRPAARVVIITQNCSVPRDRRVWSELLALCSGGYEVVAICPEGDGHERARFERREGVDIFRFAQPRASGSPLSYLREYAVAFWRIRRLARRVAGERGFDIVQASNPPDFLLMAVHFLKRRGARLIFDHHDLAPELYLARFGGDGGVFYRLTQLLERVNYRMADLVLATNESYKRIAVQRGRMRPEDVFVVRTGPDLARFGPVPADPELKRGRRALISFIGEMAPQDGVDHALRALAHLLQRRDDWHAIFAGHGGALDDLRALTTSLGLDDHVEFTGWLEDPELQRVLSASDLCLVPDPKTPLSDVSTLVKIAEYMAMSRPIVSYDLTESRVTAEEAAIYARPNEPEAFAKAIAVLLDDPDRRARMGRIGRERVERLLSWEHCRRNLLAAYEVALTREPAAWAPRPPGQRARPAVARWLHLPGSQDRHRAEHRTPIRAERLDENGDRSS